MLNKREYAARQLRTVFANIAIAGLLVGVSWWFWFENQPDTTHWDATEAGTITSKTGRISKFGNYYAFLTVKLADGTTGDFGIDPVTAVQCRVGETVPVLRKGVSLALGPTACKTDPPKIKA